MPITEMRCPACGELLSERTFGSVALHGCAKCGGVWLDQEQAKTLTARLVLASELVANKAKRAGAPPRTRRCPLDAEPLTVETRAGVEVDVCPIHGTWFDAGEIRRIANMLTKNEFTGAKPAPESKDRPTDPLEWVGAFIASIFDSVDEVR